MVGGGSFQFSVFSFQFSVFSFQSRMKAAGIATAPTTGN
jgi:hypothetical protein